jgi:hypothetical protein
MPATSARKVRVSRTCASKGDLTRITIIRLRSLGSCSIGQTVLRSDGNARIDVFTGLVERIDRYARTRDIPG